MMKKKILLSVVLLVMMFTLCACGMEPIKEQKEDSIFRVYQNLTNGMIIVDTQTNVMYWMSTAAYNYGTLTMLVEKDGSPKIYVEEGDG